MCDSVRHMWNGFGPSEAIKGIGTRKQHFKEGRRRSKFGQFDIKYLISYFYPKNILN